MLKEILEEFKIQKRVSPQEFNIIKNIILKYFEDAREVYKRKGKSYLPFNYIKEFDDGSEIIISRSYTYGGAVWSIGCKCPYCEKIGGVTNIPDYNITSLIESEDKEKIEKFLKEIIKQFQKENINCNQIKWNKFIERILNILD